MTSSLTGRLKELLQNGTDEDVFAWVVDHEDDICNALDQWSQPKRKELGARLNPGNMNDLRLMVTGEDFSHDGGYSEADEPDGKSDGSR